MQAKEDFLKIIGQISNLKIRHEERLCSLSGKHPKLKKIGGMIQQFFGNQIILDFITSENTLTITTSATQAAIDLCDFLNELIELTPITSNNDQSMFGHQEKESINNKFDLAASNAKELPTKKTN